MARRSRKRDYSAPHRELNLSQVHYRGGWTQTGGDTRDYQVQIVTSSKKSYTCPRCHRLIPIGQEHVVAWTSDHLFGEAAGVAERRHWHMGCWNQFAR